MRRQEIDVLARELVESGLALWENAGEPQERLIVRGRANLIDSEAADLDRDPHACLTIWNANATSPSFSI